MTAKVVIIQPYVPTYRVPFFEQLRLRLAREGIEIVVAAGTPRKDQEKRGDSISTEWITEIRPKTLDVRGRSVVIATDKGIWKGADAVILGLEGTAFPVYQALSDARLHGLRVGLWGHVRPYVTPGNRVDLWLEKQQMRRADHVFAYTPGGAEYAVNQGVQREKVTTVMNTVDTSGLRNAIKSLTSKKLDNFWTKHNLAKDRTVAFIGGLDESKRIGFLSEALDVLWNLDPSIKMIIGGQGPQIGLLKRAIARKQVSHLGYVDTQEKAITLKSSVAICMPGRIGLIAVDALVAERPIITTSWPFHAPEFEYLQEHSSCIITPNDPYAYAIAIQQFVNSPMEWAATWYPSISDMVQNYARGVDRLLYA